MTAPSNKQPKRFYEFGPFRLDASNHLLLSDGEPVPLAPKAADLLILLVEDRGEWRMPAELKPNS